MGEWEFRVWSDDSIMLDTGFVVRKFSAARNKSKQSEVKVFPNPSASGEFFIQNEYLFEKILVLNIGGAIIYQMEKISTRNPIIDLSNQPSGLYFLTILDKKGNTHIKKLIRI